MPVTDDVDAASHNPKYRRIFLELRQAIAGGKYIQGQRLPSEAQLSRKFATSRITVARALKELQIEGLIERRAGSGSYVRIQGEKRAATGETLGLLIPDLGETEIFEPICQGMARASRTSQHELLWGGAASGADSKEKQAIQLSEYYISRDVSGVFFAPFELTPARDEVNQSIVESFERAGIPLVLLDRDICSYPKRSRFDVVGIDNRRAGYVTAGHLLHCGARRITFLSRPHSAPSVDARIAGYLEAVRSAGRPENVFLSDPGDSESLGKVIREFSPDAIVCANDRTAGVLMHALDGLGIRVPNDIRIVGIDDVKYSSLLHVPLTTLRQPCHDIGIAAVAAMLERIEYPTMAARDIMLDCKLVVRKSCGATVAVS